MITHLEHILDAAYNKDKLGADKTKETEEKGEDDQHTSGSMTNTITATETVPKNGTLNAEETHEFANSDQNHVTNKETFDTVFPGNDILCIQRFLFTYFIQVY